MPFSHGRPVWSFPLVSSNTYTGMKNNGGTLDTANGYGFVYVDEFFRPGGHIGPTSVHVTLPDTASIFEDTCFALSCLHWTVLQRTGRRRL